MIYLVSRGGAISTKEYKSLENARIAVEEYAEEYRGTSKIYEVSAVHTRQVETRTSWIEEVFNPIGHG